MFFFKLINKALQLILALSFSTIYAQQTGETNNGNYQVNVKKMAGIITYDTSEAIKKIKVKKLENKNYVEWAIDHYNQKINELKIFNTDTFDSVKYYINQKRQEAQLSNDINLLKEAKIKVDEILQPIKNKVNDAQNTLNRGLEKHLSSKQYKAWLKYIKRKNSTLKPQAPAMHQVQNQGMRSHRGQARRY
jgi:hypothetical protein